MGIGNLLSRLISENNTTVSELSRTANVPAQTIYSIIRRDNLKANLEDLYRLSKSLGVNLDYFCQEFADIKKSSAPDKTGAEDLTKPETMLLHNFRALNEDGQDRLLETSDDMVTSGKYTKNNSIEIPNEA